jgi:CubicO group peptidase (beta-lactamase class C family)
MVLYGTSPLQAQSGWNLDKEAIDSVLELQYFSTRMPGYAMCIVKDGEIVYSGLRGKANVRDDIKMSLTTQFGNQTVYRCSHIFIGRARETILAGSGTKIYS